MDNGLVAERGLSVPAGWKVLALGIIAVWTLQCYVMIQYYLGTEWRYWGFEISQFDPQRFAIAIFWCFFPLPFLMRSREGIAAWFGWILFIVLHIPVCLLAGVLEPSAYPVLSQCQPLLASHAIAVVIIGMAGGKSLFAEKISAVSFRRRWIMLAGIGIGLLTIVLYGNQMQLVGFEEMYIHRLEARSVVSSYGEKLLLNWQESIVIPILAAIAYSRRSVFFATITLLLVTISYSAAASKSVIMNVLVVVGFLFAIRWPLRKVPPLIILLLLVLFASTIGLVACLFNFENISYLIVARGIGIPALSSIQYADYVRVYGGDMWSHVAMVGPALGGPPWSKPVHFEMGDFFYSNPDLSMNANFLATDGYLASGAIGIVVIALLFAFFLRLLDRMRSRQGLSTWYALMIPTAFNLMNVGLFTTLLSYGMILWLLVGRRLDPLFEIPQDDKWRVSSNGVAVTLR